MILDVLSPATERGAAELSTPARHAEADTRLLNQEHENFRGDSSLSYETSSLTNTLMPRALGSH